MSDFIVAKSGEHFAYDSFGCSVPFYTETVSLEHFISLAFLSLLETVPVPSGLSFPVCFVASCSFFCLLTIGIPSSCSPGQSHSQYSMISEFGPFHLASLPGFTCLHQYPTGLSTCTCPSSPELTSFCMSHLSGWCYPMARPRASVQLWLSVAFTAHIQSVTKIWWWHVLNISLFIVHTAITLLKCPRVLVRLLKMTYQ